MSVSRYEELAREWLKVAVNDLAYAELGAKEGFHAQACFVCQQVAEKSLKAYLFAQPRTTKQYRQKRSNLPAMSLRSSGQK